MPVSMWVFQLKYKISAQRFIILLFGNENYSKYDRLKIKVDIGMVKYVTGKSFNYLLYRIELYTSYIRVPTV